MAFHLALTVYSIRLGQSDLKKAGLMPSLAFIYAANCFILGTVFCYVTGVVDVGSFWRECAGGFVEPLVQAGTVISRKI